MGYRYIGNKTRLVPALLELVRSLVPDGAVVADPMCGTGSVSAALRAGGYRVVAADLMTFAVHHAKVRLLLGGPPPFDGVGRGYADVLAALNGLPKASGLFTREYSPEGNPAEGVPPRKYLSGENARQVDAIRATLGEWERAGRLTDQEAALLRHDLVLAVNRVANIAGTYGHFRSSWSPGALRPLELRPSAFEPGPTNGHRVLQGRVEELASEIEADLCYLDPPYMKRQYAANYHLLETLARGDEPDAIGVSGLRDWWDQYSDFCSKRKVADAFDAVFRKMHCSQFLVSYSEDGLLTREQLTDLFGAYGHVRCIEIPYQRFRSNQSPLGAKVTEYLFHLRME